MRNNEFYTCKSKLLPGHNYKEVAKVARRIFRKIEMKTKRRPYIRSAYFDGDKLFLDNFWPHLNQKNPIERRNRLKFLECAIEFVENSKKAPVLEIKDQFKKEVLYRFIGQVSDKYFIIQIKEDTKRGQRFLMSIFEYTKK